MDLSENLQRLLYEVWCGFLLCFVYVCTIVRFLYLHGVKSETNPVKCVGVWVLYIFYTKVLMLQVKAVFLFRRAPKQTTIFQWSKYFDNSS
jgi:hypothetical protein